jgi:hypothetical protein
LVAAVAIAAEIVLHVAGIGPAWRASLLGVGAGALLVLIVLMRRYRSLPGASHGQAATEDGEAGFAQAAKLWLIEAVVVWTAAIVLAVAGAAVSTWVGFLFAGCVFGSLAVYYLWRA